MRLCSQETPAELSVKTRGPSRSADSPNARLRAGPVLPGARPPPPPAPVPRALLPPPPASPALRALLPSPRALTAARPPASAACARAARPVPRPLPAVPPLASPASSSLISHVLEASARFRAQIRGSRPIPRGASRSSPKYTALLFTLPGRTAKQPHPDLSIPSLPISTLHSHPAC